MFPDPLEVARLHAAYCYAVDHRDGPGLAALFAPDGTLVVPGAEPVTGLEALTQFCLNAPAGVHLVGGAHVDPDGRTRTPFTFMSVEPGRLVSGYYTDELASGEDGRLVFRVRDVDIRVRWPALPVSQS